MYPYNHRTKNLIWALGLCLLCSVCFGQTWSTLPVDLLVNMNTSSPGTGLTTTILNAGTVSSNCAVGSACNWTSVASGGSYSPTFEVGANQGALSNLGPVQMTGTGGALYPAQSLNYNNMAHQDGDPGAGSNATLSFSGTPGSATKIAGLVGITLTMGASETNANDFDIFGFWEAPSGNYSMMQLNAQNSGTACVGIPSGTIGIRLEGKPTIHSPCIPLPVPGSYYASQTWNLATGVIALYVYTADGTPVKCISGVGGGNGTCNADGSSSVTMGDTGGTLGSVTIGNNEIGYNNGTITYFQNLMLNWTTAPTPLFWTSETTPPPPPTTSPCDVNGDGVVNVQDVQLEVNLALGITTPCPNADGCTVVQVQRVVNAALGGACVNP